MHRARFFKVKIPLSDRFVTVLAGLPENNNFRFYAAHLRMRSHRRSIPDLNTEAIPHPAPTITCHNYDWFTFYISEFFRHHRIGHWFPAIIVTARINAHPGRKAAGNPSAYQCFPIKGTVGHNVNIICDFNHHLLRLRGKQKSSIRTLFPQRYSFSPVDG